MNYRISSQRNKNAIIHFRSVLEAAKRKTNPMEKYTSGIKGKFRVVF